MNQDQTRDFGQVVLYRTGNGKTAIDVRLAGETVSLSLNQMAELFGRDKSVISRHLKNVFDIRELVQRSVVAKNATVQREGDREVSHTKQRNYTKPTSKCDQSAVDHRQPPPQNTPAPDRNADARDGTYRAQNHPRIRGQQLSENPPHEWRRSAAGLTGVLGKPSFDKSFRRTLKGHPQAREWSEEIYRRRSEIDHGNAVVFDGEAVIRELREKHG